MGNEVDFYEWLVVLAMGLVAGVSSMALAVRDGRYRDTKHLIAIGFVGGVVGLGAVGWIGHSSGDVRGSELLLLFVASGSGLGGRLIERVMTKKAASFFGVDGSDTHNGSEK